MENGHKNAHFINIKDEKQKLLQLSVVDVPREPNAVLDAAKGTLVLLCFVVLCCVVLCCALLCFVVFSNSNICIPTRCSVADIIVYVTAPSPSVDNKAPGEAQDAYLGVDEIGAHFMTVIKAQGTPTSLGVIQVSFICFCVYYYCFYVYLLCLCLF